MVTLPMIGFWVCVASTVLFIGLLVGMAVMQKLLIREQQKMCRSYSDLNHSSSDYIAALEARLQTEKDTNAILSRDNQRLSDEVTKLKTLRPAPAKSKADPPPAPPKPAPPTKAQVDAAKRGLGEIVRDLRA
jgi:hypothetical protein